MSKQKLTWTGHLSHGTSHSNDLLCGQDGDEGEKKHKNAPRHYIDEHIEFMDR